MIIIEMREPLYREIKVISQQSWRKCARDLILIVAHRGARHCDYFSFLPGGDRREERDKRHIICADVCTLIKQ